MSLKPGEAEVTLRLTEQVPGTSSNGNFLQARCQPTRGPCQPAVKTAGISFRCTPVPAPHSA